MVSHTGDDKVRKRGSRARATQDWLARRADTRVGRLALNWFRAYFDASRNSGSAATLYSFLSVFPAALTVAAYFHAAGSDTGAFADRLVTHLKLTGSSASLVSDTFGSASTNALAATFTVIFCFAFWGLGVGQIFQSVYARAWRVEVGSAADQGLFAIWFVVVTGVICLGVVAAEQLKTDGWLVLVPVWLVGSTAFWLWTPRFLLHRKVGLRALLPGALLAALVLGGAVGTSPLFLGPAMNSYGKYFGSFGVVAVLVGYVFIMTTMSLVCAVFSPVWAEWRQTEREAAAG